MLTSVVSGLAGSVPDRAPAYVFYASTASKFQEKNVLTSFLPAHAAPIVLLLLSNVFMTFAWYGHLNYKSHPLWIVVLASWGIAFFEYCLAVPANRLGHAVYSAAELKTMQEIITLVVFAIFSVAVLKEPITINHLVGFSLIIAGAFFVFKAPL